MGRPNVPRTIKGNPLAPKVHAVAVPILALAHIPPGG